MERWKKTGRVAVVLVGLLVAGCSPRPATDSGGRSPAVTLPPPSAHVPYAVSTSPTDAILRISIQGQMPYPRIDVAKAPLFVLYADGRIVVHPDAFPKTIDGSDFREVRATPAEIQKIVAAADEVGLLDDTSQYGEAGVTDVGDTVFRTTVGGVEHEIRVWGLEYDAATLDPAIVLARANLRKLELALLDPAGFLERPAGDLQPMAFAQLRVFVSAATPETDYARAWPLADPLADGKPAAQDRCILLSGADMTAFVGAAKGASYTSVWVSTSRPFYVIVRPLYPGESGCVSSAYD